jgi:hypothetical protein
VGSQDPELLAYFALGESKTPALMSEATGIYPVVIRVLNMPQTVTVAMTVEAADADPLMSVVAGVAGHDQLNVGEHSIVQLHSRDRYNNTVATGGLVIDAFLEGPAFVKASSTDRADGTYDIEFFGRRSGNYTFSVKFMVGGECEHASGSPFAIHVEAGRPYAPNCAASVNAELSSQQHVIVAGVPAVIDVTLRDIHMNSILPQWRGGYVDLTAYYFKFTSVAGVLLQGKLTYLGNASAPSGWQAVVTSPHAAAHEFSIFLGEDLVLEAPVQILVVPAEVMINMTTISVPPEKHLAGVAGEASYIDVLSHDKFGNLVDVGGLDVSLVQIDGLHQTVRDNENGMYVISHYFTVEELATVTVKIGDYLMYPIDFRVLAGPVSPSRCSLLENATEMHVVAGEIHYSHVVPRDKHGNIVHDPNINFQVDIVSESLFPPIIMEHPVVVHRSIGLGYMVYEFAYQFDTLATYDVHVGIIAEDHTDLFVTGSPFSVVVSADPIVSVINCTAYGEVCQLMQPCV